LYRKLGGPQGRSGRVRKISGGFDPRTVQPVASYPGPASGKLWDKVTLTMETRRSYKPSENVDQSKHLNSPKNDALQLLAFFAESFRSEHACPFLCIWLNDVLPRHRGELAFQPLSAVKFRQVRRPVADFTIPLRAFLVLKADSWLTLPENIGGGGRGGAGRKGRELVYVSVVLLDVTDRRNMNRRTKVIDTYRLLTGRKRGWWRKILVRKLTRGSIFRSFLRFNKPRDTGCSLSSKWLLMAKKKGHWNSRGIPSCLHLPLLISFLCSTISCLLPFLPKSDPWYVRYGLRGYEHIYHLWKTHGNM
jgi:hypothetical protein